MKLLRSSVRHYQWTNSKYRSLVKSGSGGLKESTAAALALVPPKVALNSLQPLRNEPLLKLVTSNFPPIQFAFGYGSGVLKQSGYLPGEEQPQIDLMFAIEEGSGGLNWHAENLLRNDGHYSGLKYFGGSKIILYVQKLGAGIYFNPLIPVEHDGARQLIKYGVVSKEDALRDLCEWSNLYIAGRLQKPVNVILDEEKETNPSMTLATEYNLQLALHLATLLLHSEGRALFSTSSLFETITSLSYLGDFRMIIGGENPNKIKNIVSKQIDRFEGLYEPYLERLHEGKIIERVGDQKRSINLQEQDVHDAVESLPLNFRTHFYKFHDNGGNSGFADPAALRRSLLKTVKTIVRYPSIIQMIKGLLTAGVTKSVKYAWEKKKKNLKRS